MHNAEKIILGYETATTIVHSVARQRTRTPVRSLHGRQSGRWRQWRFLRFVNPADRAGGQGRRHMNG